VEPESAGALSAAAPVAGPLSPVAVASASATVAFSKKTTTSKLGGVPLPHGPTVVAPAPGAAASDFSDLERLTRVTPCTLRRRDIMVATAGWLLVHPESSMAGEP